MHTLQLYDRHRKPPNWTDIIVPGQFAVFAKHVENGETLDTEGKPFAAVRDVTCLVFDGLDEAHRFCVTQVERLPFLRLEIFDAEGRRHPPLLVVVHERHARTLPAHPRNLAVRKHIATGLVCGALPLLFYDFWTASFALIYPSLIGCNMLIVAARLVHLNWCAQTAERDRVRRWSNAVSAELARP